MSQILDVINSCIGIGWVKYQLWFLQIYVFIHIIKAT